jgi:hypothetical protein
LAVSWGFGKGSDGIDFYLPNEPTYTSFKNNTVDISTAFFGSNKTSRTETPNIDFSNNYWGTSDISRIDEFIFDKNDSLSINYVVNYQPILGEKHKLTP